MAIVAENTSNGTDSGATTLTVEHICTGTESDGIIVITVQVTDSNLGDRTISGVTHNGEVCTHLPCDSDDGVEARTEEWFRLNPTTGGTPDIVVTASGKCTDLSLGAVSFTGVSTDIASNIYYFNDSTPSDPSNHWTDDALAFDNNDATYAVTVEATPDDLIGTGTNAPGSGDTINSVYARFKGYADWGPANTLAVTINNDAEPLGNLSIPKDSIQWSTWEELTVPGAGWSWAILQGLNAACSPIGGGTVNEVRLYEVQIAVQTGVVVKVATGDSTPPTLDITTIGTSSFVVDSLSSRESAGAKIATSTPDGVVIHKTDVGSDTHAATYVDAGTAGSQTMSYSDDDADTVWVMSAVAVTIAVGGIFEVSVTDGVELSDETSETMAAVPTITDGIKGGDETVELSVMEVAATDEVELGDTALGVILSFVSVTDGAKLGDTTLKDMLASPIVTDGLKGGDTTSVLAVMGLSVADEVKFGDTALGVLMILLSTTDGIEFGDTTLEDMISSPSVTDGFKSGDTTSELGTMETSVSDGIKLGDTTLGVILLLLSLTDGIKIGDTTAEDMATDSDITDGVELGDSAIGEMSSIVIVTDGLKLGDTTVLIMTASPVVTDGSLFGDTLLIQVGIVTFQLSVSDGIELGDNTSQIMSTFSVVSDGVKLGDTTSENILATVIIADGIKIGDTASGEMTINLSIIDGSLFGDTPLEDLGAITFELNVTDGMNIGDTNQLGMFTFSVINDGVKIGDVRVIEMSSEATVSDGMKLGDFTVGNINYTVVVSDGVKLGDLTSETITIAPKGVKNLGQSRELKLYLKMIEQMSKRRMD